MPYLIDSDVLIDVSRGKPAAREYIDALPEGWAISQISALELIVGARDNRDLTDIDTFLSAYVIVPLRASTGSRAYELLKRYAKSHNENRILVGNVKDLKRPAEAGEKIIFTAS